MFCPTCGNKTLVVDSVTTSERVIRRRRCNVCQKKLYTIEIEAEHISEVLSAYYEAKTKTRNRSEKRKDERNDL